MLENIAKKLALISEVTGKTLAWLTLLMVATTFTIVLLRYGFNTGWIAMQESVNYMHAMVFMLGAAYAYKHNTHVRVDIFYNKFSAEKKAWVNLLGNIFLLAPICIFILYASFDYVAIAWKIKEASAETAGLPFAYLLKTVIPLMALLLLVEALADSLRQIIQLQGTPISRQKNPS